MRAFIGFLDSLTEMVGRLVSWLLVMMMAVSCAVVAMRYLFQSGSIIFFQELVSYMHAATFMLAAAWTLKRQGHVRVDIFYRRMNPKTQAWINALGTLLFLMPFAVFVLLTSMDFVGRSWSIRETSADAGGIPLVYLLKTLIPASCLLLLVQGFVELMRNGILICWKDGTPANEEPAQ